MRNKKLAAGIGGVTAVAAAVAISAGTFAAFSDTETGGVEATAGTLNLEVGGIPAESGVFKFGNVKPGQDLGSTNLSFKNTGSVDGTLQLELIEVTNKENGQNGPEKAVDNSTDEGELLENLDITVNGYSFNLTEGDKGQRIDNLPNLTAGDEQNYTVSVSVSDDAANEIQSDKASFKVQANLDQVQQ